LPRGVRMASKTNASVAAMGRLLLIEMGPLPRSITFIRERKFV
jgi:hypothetical protein